MFSDAILSIANKLFKTEVKGLEKLDFSSPSILIPNHTSLADVAVLIKSLPKDVYFVSNTRIAKQYAAFMKGRNVITVDPLNPYSVRDMVRVINQGKPLVVFPEGRITRTGSLMKIYQGVGYMAMKTGAKVFPITIDGLERSKFSYLNDMHKTTLFPNVKVAIGDPFTIERVEGVSMKKQKEDAADLILRTLQKGRFDIKEKSNVNLFNELIDASEKFGIKTKISEDINGVASYKDLLLNTYVLSNKFETLLKDEKNIGVLMPNANAHAVILFSLFRIGKTPAILNFSVGKQTIQDSCETAGLKTVITSQSFIEKGNLHHLIKAFQEKNIRILYLDKLNETTLSDNLLSFANSHSNITVLLPESTSRLSIATNLVKKGIEHSLINVLTKEDVENRNIGSLITTNKFLNQKGNEEIVEFIEKNNIPIYFFEEKDDLLLIKNRKGNVQQDTVITEFNGKETYYHISTSEKLSGLFSFMRKEKSSFSDNDLILFTSGSESKPKGVVLSHDNIYSNIYQARSIIDFTSKDKILNALPMFHSFGLTAGTFLPLLLGVPVYLYPSPLHYRVVPEIAYDRMATIIFGTSTFLSGYGRYAHPYDFFSLRYVFAGAEKLKPEVSDMWFNKFGIRIFEGYGITETAPILSLNTPLAYKKGTVGRFMPGVDFKIEPVEGIEKGGLLFVKGPNVMKGYLIHEKGFIPKDEWYDTGDVVDVDDDGFISILSRVKRFTKIAGEMISLNLVEQLATKCFNHEGFATVNIPDARKGEQIVLFTTMKDVPKDVLREYITSNGHTSLYVPSKIVYIDKLPLLGSGKSDYVTLKKLAENN